MHEYPHYYRVSANAASRGYVSLNSGELEPIASAPPVEFDGPGDLWSPEELLVAAVADCFVLSFRGVANASRFDWLSLDCHVEGKLERSGGKTLFTTFQIKATLRISPGVSEEKAHRLLARAEHVCLITNSLTGQSQLTAIVLAQPET